jgi:elongation factor Ts
VSQVQISAGLVKELRDLTGAGMMAAKRALEETGGDLEAAQRLLREQGMAAAGKKAGRETTEGEVLATVSGTIGAIVAIGCETEPVSKNEEFLRFAETVLEAVETGGQAAVAGLEEQRLELIGRLGENIEIRGASRMEAGDGELLAEYVHPPANKIGVLVKLVGGTPELARQLAMHISFAAPEWTTKEDVPAELVEAEKQVYLNSDELAGKPEQAKEKIVEGMLAKRFYAAQPGGVLTEQPWIHDSAQSVGQALAAGGAHVAAFKRFSVAE